MVEIKIDMNIITKDKIIEVFCAVDDFYKEYLK
jgi:hypothetical protein